jgi:hypothetical protein
MKKHLQNTLLVCASLLLAFLCVEGGARFWLAHKYLLGNFKTTSTFAQDDASPPDNTDPVGWEQPNRTHFYYVYNENSDIVWHASYHFNNMGLVSKRNYHRDRKPAEYRVAIIGDSFTASVQMMTPWPDTLEDILNADDSLKARLGVTAFRVYNFGMYAAGFQDFVNLAKIAKKLDPDMVIVNFIAADFPRCNNCTTEIDNPLKDKARQLVTGEIPVPIDEAATEVGYLRVSCEQPPVDFSNDTCRHSYNLALPPAIAADPGKVRKVKQEVVRRFLRGQLLTSLYPYSIAMALGKSTSLTDLRHPDWFKGPETKKRDLTQEEIILQAADSMRAIRDMFPGKVFLGMLNPTYDDLTWQPAEDTTRALLAAAPWLAVKFMREYLPQGKAKEEMYAWFCLPHDGHMSDKGGVEYAKATARVITEALSGGL